ncbi:hypothetical protein LWI29_017064 [Acer saccharum]|uniref:Uncharacterized protein n=2 Tax=Acer saccharum TaxID=4024 RepID=A0AA39SL89_ACESA|nr:hypothetical protein LWI29_017064 [Acer saccharum]
MVDAVVSFVLERLGDFLIQEAVFLGGVGNEAKLLQNELEWMQCYIANAEGKQVDDPMIRKWLSDITEISYDIEDVIDKIILQVHEKTTIDLDEEKKPAGGCFSPLSCTIFNKKSSPSNKGKEKVNLYNTGKGIEVLKIRINDLSRKREWYGLQDSAYKTEGKTNTTTTTLGRLKQLRRATSFSVEEKIVGFEDDANSLLAKLLDGESHRSVISIYGMGGLGKTTLAKKLYHTHGVKMKFIRRAWVSVSQDYNTCDLLIRIIHSFGIASMKTDDLKHMTEEELERYLYGSLRGRLYLIVIDDVWQKEAWESIKRAFPDSNNGSRVIITTRIREVAERSDERTHAHKLRFLRLDESWQLFCEKTFGNSDANDADVELKTLGMEMVQKCSGLPLAIVVLGGLLSTKSKLQEWKLVREHIWQNLRDDSIHVSYLLALSFNDLPYRLKLCFLYLSLFPEDFEIDVEKLLRLWIAEGFIPQERYQMLEDMAKNSFDDLVGRSLILIEKRSWGRVATCRVHDLFRDLAIQKAKELKFLHIYDQFKPLTGDPSRTSMCRRQAIYSAEDVCSSLRMSNANMRSILFFNPDKALEVTINFPVMCKFKFLRVLDFDGYDKRYSGVLYEGIGKLIYLKHLGLRKLGFSQLPSSILNLWRLQTLDLFSRGAEVELPNKVYKLQELRHLIGLFTGPLQIDSLTKLQSLKFVNNESWSKINPEKLVNLRELSIYSRLCTEEKVFRFDSVVKLPRLEQLSVRLSPGDSFASLQPLSSCSYLTDLRLLGNLKKLPEDIDVALPNLECLLLKNSWLRDDPMPLLGKLPCLMILYLHYNFYSGKRLTCRALSFPRLEILKLGRDDQLEKWRVEEGAMPRLRGLSMPQNSTLRIPERLRSIPPPAESEFETGDLDLLF